jgi:hypothetical protein
LILPSWISKRGEYCGIMCNKMYIKVNESKKTLKVMNKGWGSPIHNGLNHIRIPENVIPKNSTLV